MRTLRTEGLAVTGDAEVGGSLTVRGELKIDGGHEHDRHRLILKRIPGASEVYRIEEYRVWISRRELILTVLDAGSSVEPSQRYVCELRRVDGGGKPARSNNCGTLDEALFAAVVHVRELDLDDEPVP